MSRKNCALSVWGGIAVVTVAVLIMAGLSVWPGGRQARAALGQDKSFDGDVTVSGTLTARAIRLAGGVDVVTSKQLAEVKAEVLKSTMDSLTKQLKTRSSSWAVANFAAEINKKVTESLARNLASRSSSGAAGQLRKELTSLVQAEVKRQGSSSSSSRSDSAELARLKRALDDLQRKYRAAERKLDDLEDEVEKLRREVKRR